MSKWERVNKEEIEIKETSRPSLTYWQDAWRRLKENKLSMIGLVTVGLMFLVAFFGPFLSKYSYEDQNLKLANMPPKLETYTVGNKELYVHPELKVFSLDKDGTNIQRLKEVESNMVKKFRAYEVDGKRVVLDFKNIKKAKKDPTLKKYQVFVGDKEVADTKITRNKVNILGTDSHGRDLLVRIIYGARISLTVAVVATLVNFFVGVLYGGISGYLGGRVDSLMMRFVDTISTIPLLLYVILLMVIIEPGLKTIIVALGLTFWVRMARLVRGQTLTIKNHEYVLAAKTLGASNKRILVRHIIPNALGPIIVTLTMMIPSAIFTEAFLSFIGLGVAAPMASWGTLASDALGGLRTYPYQLLYPALAICITMLSFNFLGNGLRDALDPRLRK